MVFSVKRFINDKDFAPFNVKNSSLARWHHETNNRGISQ